MKRRGGVSKPAVVAVVVMVAGIAAAAWYSESITYFIRLQAWDQKAPTRVVDRFLAAVEAKEQESANRLLAEEAPKPLVRDGKWLGYESALPTGTRMEYRLKDLGSRNALEQAKTEFVYTGGGWALVTLKGDAANKSQYRLKREGSEWRITEIPGAQFVQ